MEKPTVSIGIPAYGAEDRIQQLLLSLLNQKDDNYLLQELIVHVDKYADATGTKAAKLNNSRIKVIESPSRVGYAGAMQRLFTEATGDILVTFNDDIKIEDVELLTRIVEPFIIDRQVGVATGRPIALPPKTFMAKAVASTDLIYSNARYDSGDYNNVSTVDGKAMAFSRRFIESFKFPVDLSVMGCVDLYFYYDAKARGFKYIHLKDAIVFGKNPDTVRDYIKFNSRVFTGGRMMQQTFSPEIMREQTSVPKKTIIGAALKELVRNPLGLFAIVVLNRYVKWKAKKEATHFNDKWDSVATSKNL